MSLRNYVTDFEGEALEVVGRVLCDKYLSLKAFFLILEQIEMRRASESCRFAAECSCYSTFEEFLVSSMPVALSFGVSGGFLIIIVF